MQIYNESMVHLFRMLEKDSNVKTDTLFYKYQSLYNFLLG